ncbi:MAG: hypothetical protein CO093_09550 [Alphaproteobacteria bacterium CG_4_9_14_3_um_filter_47_13]|nr:MAG: hypothetical protein CO093_09550 [Alphaproteobacteria bacterium CG_4_9_14_3_um_filter_47_13]
MEWLKSQFKLHPDKNKGALAKALGLEPPAISKILGGARQIKAQEYIIMRRFFGLPVDGERALRSGSLPKSKNSYILEPLASGMKDREQQGSKDQWIMPASLFESRTSAPPEKIRIFAVQENAMAPDITRGEKVLVDLSDIMPTPAGIFIVSDGLGHIIRQCEYIPHSDPPSIRLSSSNPRFKSYVTELDKAEIIGRVIAKLQWL